MGAEHFTLGYSLSSSELAMEPLYDSRGEVVAFMRGDRIIGRDGSSVAWLRGPNVYGYQGQHLGWWNTDHLRERDGGVSLWQRGARAGVILPIPRIPPVPPIPRVEPIRPVPRIPPVRPVNRLGWSRLKLGS